MSTRHAKDRDITSSLPATDRPSLKQSLEVALAARGTGGQVEFDLWQGVLALDPEHVSALLNATRCAIGLGEADRAIELAERACAIRPGDAACTTWLARAFEAGDRPEDALSAWERVIELKPSSDVHVRAARLAVRVNQPSRAIEHHRAVVRLDPDNPRAHAALARALWDAGEKEQAQQVAEHAIAHLPTAVEPVLEAARIARDTGGQAELDLWEQVLALDPAHVTALLNAARCTIGLGDADRAIELTERACAIRPDNPACVTWLARAFEAAERNHESLAAWQRALELQPSTAVLTSAAHSAALTGDRDLAVHYLEEALRLDPDNPKVHTALTRALWDAGRQSEALAHAGSGIERFPDEAAPLLEAARLAQIDFRADDALDLARRALAVDPGNLAASVRVADALRLRGDLESALDTITSAWRATEQPTASIVRSHVNVLLSLGRFDQASAIASAADDGSPAGAALAAELAGIAALEAWDLEAAHAHLARACELVPTSSRWAALARYHLLRGDVPAAKQANALWAEAIRATRARSATADDRVVRSTAGFLGEIINEESIDMVASTAAMSAIDAGDVDRSLEVVRTHPHALSAARGLMVTLQRAGLLNQREPRTPDRRIPRIIGQAWLGSALPDDARALVEGWQATNPDWEYVLFTSQSARDWLGDRHGARAVAAFRAAHHPAAKADLLRLAVLVTRGGVWCDIDDRALSPLDGLVAGRSLIGRLEMYATVANNFLAAVPGHPALQLALDEVIDTCLVGYTETTWLATGPGLITRCLARWISDDLDSAGMGTDTLIVPVHRLANVVAMHQPLAYKAGPLAWQRVGSSPVRL
jgi:tetratricopeptide (TPR) repeat protein